MHGAYASIEKFTLDIKDDGEYCKAIINNDNTVVSVFSNKNNIESRSFTIKDQAVLQQTYVDGVCVLTGSKTEIGFSMYIISSKTGELVKIKNPIAFAENASGSQIAIEYFDKDKRSVYFVDSKGKENHVHFSNYSVAGLGYNSHKIKFTPDDESLMIIEGMDFPESMVLISTSKKRDVKIKGIPASIANTQGALTFVDDRTAVFVDDSGTFIVSELSQKNIIPVMDVLTFAGSFDNNLVFLNSKKMVLYSLKSDAFGKDIDIPSELSDYLQKNPIEYAEVKQSKGKRFSLETPDGQFYLFNADDNTFEKIQKDSACSVTGSYCLQ